ncbi:MAG: ABC transporter ATP-binding protein [Nitrososphaerota archaeon]|jgi:ABC-2 type transport system ATP-binding protein|nr:ABC transporter ATP-binding protein [Nitrososphaerota archaeon]
MSLDEIAISVDDLCHSYNGKDYVVNDLTFNVKRGEIFGLLGKNGAGKSTTIKILTTLIQPSKGEAKILGHDLRREGSKIRPRIGVVQQDTSFEFSTVKENFDLYGFLWGVPKEIRTNRRDELVKMFDLGDLLKKSTFDLSGGQQRRVQVAREFVHDMDLLFLDEPTVGLDPIMRRKILDMLKEKARNDKLTIIFTTHNLEEADYLCDRVAIMDRGRFQALDTTENLKRVYGETKAIEVLFAASNGAQPSYEKFFELLSISHPDVEISKMADDDSPAVIVSRHPEQVIKSMISIATDMKSKLEWLNVRKSTLEDVFLQTVSDEETSA